MAKYRISYGIENEHRPIIKYIEDIDENHAIAKGVTEMVTDGHDVKQIIFLKIDDARDIKSKLDNDPPKEYSFKVTYTFDGDTGETNIVKAKNIADACYVFMENHNGSSIYLFITSIEVLYTGEEI